VFRAAISGRALGRLFDIVSWDHRERFGDEPQFDARLSVLVLSAGAVKVPQIRAGGARVSKDEDESLMLQARVAPAPCFRPVSSCCRRQSAPAHLPPVARISCCHPRAYGKAAGAGCARPPVFLLLFTGKNRGTEWVGPRARSLIAASRLAMLAAVQGDNGVQ
jgi:hypothetical protein